MVQLGIFLASLVAPRAASARVYDMFRSDSPKGAFCDAIGGACAGDPDLENGFFQNPATMATGETDWNFDGDISAKSNLEPGMAAGNSVSETETNAAVAYSTGRFGFGFSFSRQSDSVDGSLTVFDNSNIGFKTKATSSAHLDQFNAPLAFLVSERFSVGITPSILVHKQTLSLPNSTDANSTFPTGTGFALLLGAHYRPAGRFQFGTWFRIPNTIYERTHFLSTVSATSIDYTEDFALHFPWVWAAGTAVLLGSGYSLFFENDLIGATESGQLLSYDTLSATVGDANLVGKGRSVVAQPHWGARKILTQKLTLHAGGYYETSRWEGFPGRLHTSGGVSFKVAEWLEVVGGFDLARDFKHVFFTFR